MEAQERYQAKLHLVAAMQAGKSWQAAAQEAQLPISRDSAYRLARWAKEAGSERLREGRHGHQWKLRGAVREWLEQHYQEHPTATAATVQILLHEQWGVTLSMTHLNRFRATLRAAGRLGGKGAYRVV